LQDVPKSQLENGNSALIPMLLFAKILSVVCCDAGLYRLSEIKTLTKDHCLQRSYRSNNIIDQLQRRVIPCIFITSRRKDANRVPIEMGLQDLQKIEATTSKQNQTKEK
jgi:hypothetical protein